MDCDSNSGWFTWGGGFLVHVIGISEGGGLWPWLSFQLWASCSYVSSIFALSYILVLTSDQQQEAHEFPALCPHKEREKRQGEGSILDLQMSKESFLRNPQQSSRCLKLAPGLIPELISSEGFEVLVY